MVLKLYKCSECERKFPYNKINFCSECGSYLCKDCESYCIKCGATLCDCCTSGFSLCEDCEEERRSREEDEDHE